MKRLTKILSLTFALVLCFASCDSDDKQTTNATAPSSTTVSGDATSVPDDTSPTTDNTTNTSADTEPATDGVTNAPVDTAPATDDATNAPVDTAPHTHAFGTWNVTKNATCTEDGEKTRTCTCGEIESETIPAAHTEKVISGKAATCTEAGLTDGKKCTVCDAVLVKQTEIAAKGHSYSNGVCTVCGRSEFQANEGLQFILNDDGESYSLVGIGSCYDSEIVIPSTHKEKPVTAIKSHAFAHCTHITSIIIPDSITIVGAFAFGDCPSLKFNEHNNGKYLGNKNNPYVVLYDVIDISAPTFEIPDSTNVIYNDAFSSCYNLTSLMIPDSVKSIGKGAFSFCEKLTNITIPDSVTDIGEYSTFGYCTSLKSIIIGKGVETICKDAFNNCTSLESVTISYGVKKIADNAFYECSSLNNLTIPNSVISIGERAFYKCSSLTSIIIPDSVTTIEHGAFYECSSLANVVIGNGLTNISDSMLGWCTSLKDITIPTSVVSISDEAFYCCRSLEKINFQGTVEQWEAIEKSDKEMSAWNEHAGYYKIYCIDGTISR